MLKTGSIAIILIGVVGCASARRMPDPRPACIRLVVRNDGRTQANIYVDGATSSRRRIASVPSLSHESVWLEARDLDADSRFSASVREVDGSGLALSPVSVTCHDGTLHLDVASLASTSALYVAAR
jgi:hypothetical protein